MPKTLGKDGQLTDGEMEAIMELKLWPDIRAMLVEEIALIAQRFPQFENTTEVN